ncbi:hypothetical protein [Devosia sp. FKR38]|uniref:hypothetical protein n=1 Tax=Devosia sp. FKR38 TaxID=2562312 RepID=UPI0010C09B6A|nr:hypothetical protein [Devosia sp. FKR38]
MSSPAPARPRRFPWLTYGLISFAIAFLAALPLFSVLFTAFVADMNGCQVDEGSPHPCMVMGQDWGDTLYFTGVMGWLMLATLPLGIMGLVGIMVIAIIHRIIWGRRQKDAQ